MAQPSPNIPAKANPSAVSVSQSPPKSGAPTYPPTDTLNPVSPESVASPNPPADPPNTTRVANSNRRQTGVQFFPLPNTVPVDNSSPQADTTSPKSRSTMRVANLNPQAVHEPGTMPRSPPSVAHVTNSNPQTGVPYYPPPNTMHVENSNSQAGVPYYPPPNTMHVGNSNSQAGVPYYPPPNTMHVGNSNSQAGVMNRPLLPRTGVMWQPPPNAMLVANTHFQTGGMWQPHPNTMNVANPNLQTDWHHPPPPMTVHMVNQDSQSEGKRPRSLRGESVSSSFSPYLIHTLANLDEVWISQMFEVLEAIIPVMDMGNRYKIKNSEGLMILFAHDESQCFLRLILCGRHPLYLYITNNTGEVMMQLFRPVRCCSCFTCYCLPEMRIESPPGQLRGTVREAWSICSPTYKVYDHKDRLVLTIIGDCCYFICCFDVDFTVFEGNSDNVMAHITKHFSGCKEICGSANDFSINFREGVNLTKKILVIGSTFLIDYNNFENTCAVDLPCC